ncbi:MAG: hypothetical protein VXZ72_02690, partial [Chlamydiota bacterium]|nr:hypothetical protein [Chlamydiota bacterium]
EVQNAIKNSYIYSVNTGNVRANKRISQFSDLKTLIQSTLLPEVQNAITNFYIYSANTGNVRANERILKFMEMIENSSSKELDEKIMKYVQFIAYNEDIKYFEDFEVLETEEWKDDNHYKNSLFLSLPRKKAQEARGYAYDPSPSISKVKVLAIRTIYLTEFVLSIYHLEDLTTINKQNLHESNDFYGISIKEKDSDSKNIRDHITEEIRGHKDIFSFSDIRIENSDEDLAQFLPSIDPKFLLDVMLKDNIVNYYKELITDEAIRMLLGLDSRSI